MELEHVHVSFVWNKMTFFFFFFFVHNVSSCHSGVKRFQPKNLEAILRCN